MTSVQKAVFPGIAVGVMFMFFFISLLVQPDLVAASSEAYQLQQNLGAADQYDTTQQGASIAPEGNGEAAAADVTGCQVSTKFPENVRRWCDLIDKYARQNGLDSNLVASVMLQESSGNPDAYSRSGAVGLMQVMPRDGLATKFQCINGPCFADRPSMAELADPEFNISFGTNMLSGLINRTGSVRDALKSYGPMDMGYRYADIVLGIFERYR
jgi:hypothetical protein